MAFTSRLHRLFNKSAAPPAPEESDPSVADEEKIAIPQELELYAYAPLEKNEIRTFYLHLIDRFDEEITGQLFVTNLPTSEDQTQESSDESQHGQDAHFTPYTSVSYAWGPTYEDGSHLNDYIICDGRKLRVTASLKQALRRIRQLAFRQVFRSRPKSTQQLEYLDDISLKRLWVDAICINQEDVQERSSQVQMMGRIFSICRTLIIWLGEPDEGRLGVDQCKLLRDQVSEERVSQYIRSTTQRLKAVHHDNLSVLQSILARSWFHRRWVIQEAAPQDVPGYIMLGDAVCFRERLTSLMKAYGLLSPANPLQKPRIDQSIFETLLVYDVAQCEDPRDRIFAVRSLSRHAYKIKVDYNRDVRETYLNLVRSVVLGITEVDDFSMQFLGGEERQTWDQDSVEAIKMLAIGSCKKRAATHQSEAGMETWLPDWTADTCFNTRHHREAVEMCVFSNHGIESGHTGFEQRLMASRSGYCYLGVEGILVDQYHSSSQEMTLPDDDDHDTLGIVDSNDSLASWAKDMYKVAKVLAKHPNTQSHRIWLCMAIYKDKTMNDGPRFRKTLAFILRPSERSQTIFDERPIYSLQTCLTAPAPTREDRMWLTDKAFRQQRVSSTDHLLWEAFCLE